MTDLEEIKQRIKIVDICYKHGLHLIKRGKNFLGLCPFHNEKTPSFTINNDENFYKCFGCQAGGDVIEFYKDYFRLDYATAIKELKSLAGLNSGSTITHKHTAPEKAGPADFNLTRLKECLSNDELYLLDERLGLSLESEEASEETNKAAIRAVQSLRLENNIEIFFELYVYCLKHFGKDVAFNSYLREGRKLSPEIIERKELFYIGNYNQVNSHLKKTFKLEDLQRSGLFNEKGNMIFFNHKLVIPYKYKNEIVYLRARCIGEANGFSKYLGLKNDELNLNTPKRFYNADILSKLFPGEHLYITEGEFDAIMMEDLGYNAVGIPGVGNIPAEVWLKRLFPFKVILLPDGDEAGNQLKDKLQSFFNKYYKSIYTKQLPAKDVSELVKEFVN
jgi:DNA primase